MTKGAYERVTQNVIREQAYLCGNGYMEVDIYPVTLSGPQGEARGQKRNESTKEQQTLNLRHAQRWFTQKAHANYSSADWTATLTYQDEFLPSTLEEARANVRSWVRRINYRRLRDELPALCYMGVTECEKDDGATSTRFHHHLLLDGRTNPETYRALWYKGQGISRQPIGMVDVNRLDFSHGHILGLCSYMMKNPAGKQRWMQSRNLRRPIRLPADDAKYSREALERLCKERVDDYPYWCIQYPGWEPIEPPSVHYSEYQGWYLYLRMRRVDFL